jgi:hypothetical protein
VTAARCAVARGGVWFERGTQQVHCGVEPEFWPGRRHPALLVDDLEALRPLSAPVSRCGGSRRFPATAAFLPRIRSVTESN